MARARSPSYPNFPLSEAVERVEHVFNADRQNPVDRETIATHIGYRGLSGASDKAISTLSQYGLLEKVAKGEMRVTDLAVDILHPESPDAKNRALWQAARHPHLFAQLFDRFSVVPSSNALQSYLKREGFLERAINPISSAYLETCRLLEQSGAYDFPVPSEDALPESGPVQSTQVRPSPMPEVAATTNPAPSPALRAAADVFNLSGGGQVSMLLPATLSRTEYDDLKDWLDLMARRAERRVSEAVRDESSDDAL